MKRLAPALLALSLAAAAPLALAQEVIERENDVSMRLGNDLYAAGDTIDVAQPIDGDLNAAGNTISVTANVGGDVQAGGNAVHISGDVADDVRVAAGNVIVSGNVAGDVIVFAGSVTIADGAAISGNLLAAGGTVTVQGAVGGNVNVDAGRVTLSGPVGGNVKANADQLTFGSQVEGNAEFLTGRVAFESGAGIAGDLRYWNEQGQLNTAGVVAGAAVFDPELGGDRVSEEEAGAVFAGFLGVMSLYMLLSAALSIAVFMLATKTIFTESAKRLNKAPGWSILVGLLYFVAMPGVIVLLAITIIGIPLALAALALYALTILFAKIVTSIVLARWTELYFKKKWHPVAAYFAALGFYVLLKLLSLVPILGWIVVFLAVLAAYGAFATVKYERFQKVR